MMSVIGAIRKSAVTAFLAIVSMAQAGIVVNDSFTAAAIANPPWNINVTTVATLDDPNDRVIYKHTAGTARRWGNLNTGLLPNKLGYLKASISGFTGSASIWFGFWTGTAGNNKLFANTTIAGNGVYEVFFNNTTSSQNFDNGNGWAGSLASGTGLWSTNGGTTLAAIVIGDSFPVDAAIAGFGFANFGNGNVFPSSSFNVEDVVVADTLIVGSSGYTVTYDANGGTGTQTDPNSPYATNATVTVMASAFTRAGHTFAHWNTAANDGGTSYNPSDTFTITGNTNLYAQWTINTYTLTYNADAHGSISGPTPQVIDYQASGTEVTAVPDSGYAFSSWSDGVLTAARTDTGVTSNITVTASFVEAPAGVYFSAGPNTTNAGAIISPLTVTVTNASGVGISGIPVTLSKLSGSGTVVGTLAQITVGGGVATFTDVSIQVPDTGYQLRATAGALTADSALFDIIAGPLSWPEFVTAYSLTGNQFDDADEDEVFDVFEYAHGGNPTNAADQGILPYVEYGTGDPISFISVETAHTNPGITYTAEWTDGLGTNEWKQVWGATNRVASTLPGYDEVERQVTGGTYDTMFFRNRLFNIPSTNRPNIVIIMCDDLGYSDVGFSKAYSFARWGQQVPEKLPAVQTPQIDALAAEGMMFAQAYVPHPFCGPSRMGIMTGRYPHQFGGLENLPYETANRPSQATQDQWGYEPANEIGGIPTNEITMATVLQDAGYHTGAIGKWHMGVADFTHPNNRGFDHWYGMLGGGHNYYAPWITKTSAVNDYQFKLTLNADEVDSPTGPPHYGYLTDLLSINAVDFITNAPTGQPFFLYLNYNAPHSPMQAKSQDLIARFGGSGNYGDYSDRQNLVAMMDAVDRGVGDVADALIAKGVMNNTLIVFLSDNGGREVEDDADNNPLKGGKGDTYDGGVRSPMFMHYPGVIPAGAVYDYPMRAYDFYPTFARLAETAIPEGKVLSGKDIWDAILSNTNAHVDDTFIWARYLSNGFSLGLRQNNIKATRKNYGVWTVNDLSTDINEAGNIITDPAASDVLDEMLLDGQEWGTHGVDPLWFNSEVSYTNWNDNGMPEYNQSFSR